MPLNKYIYLLEASLHISWVGDGQKHTHIAITPNQALNSPPQSAIVEIKLLIFARNIFIFSLGFCTLEFIMGNSSSMLTQYDIEEVQEHCGNTCNTQSSAQFDVFSRYYLIIPTLFNFTVILGSCCLFQLSILPFCMVSRGFLVSR